MPKLQPLSAVPVHLVRRFSEWKPWTVLAAGAVVALIGIPLMLDTKSNYDAYDSDIARQCPSGCTAKQIPATAQAAYNRGRTENAAAVTLFAAGGAVVATGIVLLILNQPHPEAAGTVIVTPAVSGKATGVSALWRF